MSKSLNSNTIAILFMTQGVGVVRSRLEAEINADMHGHVDADGTKRKAKQAQKGALCLKAAAQLRGMGHEDTRDLERLADEWTPEGTGRGKTAFGKGETRIYSVAQVNDGQQAWVRVPVENALGLHKKDKARVTACKARSLLKLAQENPDLDVILLMPSM